MSFSEHEARKVILEKSKTDILNICYWLAVRIYDKKEGLSHELQVNKRSENIKTH